MNKVTVNLSNGPDRSYSIYAGNGLFGQIPELLKKNVSAGKYAVISDDNVAKIYGRKLVLNMNKAGLNTVLITFKAGEKSKTIQTAERLLEKLNSKKMTRGDCVIALGGGVTGDLAGFAASIYMRGIHFVQIPTSLLAMVDSSIGGKTGVNLTNGKNLVGTFYQPGAVIIDPEILKTLPKREFLNGFAEIIKYAAIADDKLFGLLEKTSTKDAFSNPLLLHTIIIQCCKIKASIIGKDEMEKDLRMILNYGHTVGHAIERLSKYKIEHGAAIIFGMKIANQIAYNLDILKQNDLIRINNLLMKFRPTNQLVKNLPKISKKKIGHKLWSIMQSDKKMHKSKIRFILPITIGKTRIHDGITKEIFMKAFDNESK